MTTYKTTRNPSPKHGLTQEILDHFSTHPFLRPTLDDPTFHPVSMSREVTHDGQGHTLMAKTWNTPETITHLLSFYRQPTPSTSSERGEVRRFYTFGSDLNAHPSILHGGVLSCILDSSLGGAVGLAFRETATTNPHFTVQLNVSYKSPVRTPGTVLVRAWVREWEGEGGRKVWAEGQVEGEGGVVCARAEGVWVRAGRGKKGGKL